MKTSKEKDYTNLSNIAQSLGLVPYIDRMGRAKDGIYTLGCFEAPIDLSACAEDEISILKTAVQQLSESVNESYHNAIERDLAD